MNRHWTRGMQMASKNITRALACPVIEEVHVKTRSCRFTSAKVARESLDFTRKSWGCHR